MVHEHKSTAIRRKEITRAARRLIIKRGAEHVTIRGIAEEVGISEAAIYRHFRSKKDILRLLLDDGPPLPMKLLERIQYLVTRC